MIPPQLPDDVRPKILIAEDHDINQELMLAMVRRFDVAATIAVDGAQAVAMVKQESEAGEPFDLVLMDIQMPLVDGLEATRRLRAAGFTAQILPIVALTANAFASDVEACLAAGMQHHVSKPIRLSDITFVIEQYAKPSADRRISLSTPEPEPLPASLVDQYVKRKADVFEAVSVIAEQGGTFEEYQALAALLHKVAGSAAFFHDASLGDLASELEQKMSDSRPEVKHRLIVDGWDQMRKLK